MANGAIVAGSSDKDAALDACVVDGDSTSIPVNSCALVAGETVAESRAGGAVVDAGKAHLNGVFFQKLAPDDCAPLKCLHEICFPVHYNNRFYSDLAKGSYQGVELITRVSRKLNDVYMLSNLGPVECNIENSRLVGGITAQMKTLDPGDNEQPLLSQESFRLGYSKGCYILTLATDATCRRMGIGSSLLRYVLEMAKVDPCCGVVYLHVITYNTGAIQFYEGQGFVRVRTAVRFYKIKGEFYDSYLYALYLGDAKPAPKPRSLWDSIVDTVTNLFGSLFT